MVAHVYVWNPPYIVKRHLRPIIPVDGNILVREVARPNRRLGLVPLAQLHFDLEILGLQDLRRALLVHALRLAFHQQLQLRAAVRRHEAHARLLRDDGLHARVPRRAQDAPPVCVLAVQGRLDERRARDRVADLFGLVVGAGVCDADSDELGCAFAVADDEFGEGDGEGGEGCAEGFEGGGVRGGDLGTAGGAVGEDGDGVVGRGVAVDGDAVEGLGYGGGEGGLQKWRGHGRVGADDAEEGGHVGVDHARAFGHAREVVFLLAAGQGEGLGDELGEGVGRADGFCGAQPVVVGGAELVVGVGELGDDLVDGEALADDAGAHHDAPAALAVVLAVAVLVEALVCLHAHAYGVLDAAFACHGIGASRVDDDGSDAIPASLLEYVSADCHRRSLELVRREHSGGCAGCVGSNEGEVIEARVGSLDAHMGTSSLEAQRIRARRRNVLLLRSGDVAIARRRVCAHLTSECAGACEPVGTGACEGHCWLLHCQLNCFLHTEKHEATRT